MKHLYRWITIILFSFGYFSIVGLGNSHTPISFWVNIALPLTCVLLSWIPFMAYMSEDSDAEPGGLVGLYISALCMIFMLYCPNTSTYFILGIVDLLCKVIGGFHFAFTIFGWGSDDGSSTYSSNYSYGQSSGYSSVVDKQCSRCGSSVSLSSHSGENCPRCGAYWSSERQIYR